MKKFTTLLLLIITVCMFVLPAVISAQFGVMTKDDRIAYTHEWKGERFPDGRPKVPDDIITRMKDVSIEEAWGVLMGHGYARQFEGDWDNMHPDRVIVGRAVTAYFMPQRPDVEAETERRGKEKGCIGGQNSWVIDTLVKNDLIVVDMFLSTNFAGDNLANSIAAKSGTGMVIYGGNRDLDGFYEIPNFNTFAKFWNPKGIDDVTLMGINTPARIGPVTVMPGDVVLGRREGVIFIPPHLAEQVVERSEIVRLRDEFGHRRLREGKYTPGEIDRKWSEPMEKDYSNWLKENMNDLPVPANLIREMLKERQ
ncbi:RraA family protein [Candidatus Latescibacterota bacterium]